MNKTYDNILKYGSCFLVFFLPLFYIGDMHFAYASPKTFLFFGVVEVLVAFYLYALFTGTSYRLSKKKLTLFLPLICFVIWMSLAGVLAVNPKLSFYSSLGRGTGLLTLYHGLAFAFIIASLVKKHGSIYLNKLLNYFVGGGFVLALSLWFGNEGFNTFKFLENSNGGGLMGNSSLAAAYLIFVLFFGFFLLASSTNKSNKWWLSTKLAVILFSPIFINIIGVFSGGSFNSLLGSARGATLGILIGLLVTIVFYLFFSKKKVYRALGVAGIVIGVLVFSIAWAQLVKPNTYLHNKFSTVATGGTRFIFWDIAQKAMNKHPYFGYGPENYMIAFQENFNPQVMLPKYGGEVWTDRAHNIYYETGVAGGYMAIVFYFLIITSLFYGLYKLYEQNIYNRKQISILFGLIVGYVFQNLFVFDSTLSIMALFVLAGFIFANTNHLIEEKHLNKNNKTNEQLSLSAKNTIAGVLIVACSISLIFFVYRPVQKSFIYYSIIRMPNNIRVNYYDDLAKGSSIGEDWDVGGISFYIHKYYNIDPVKIKSDVKLLPYAINDIKGLIVYLEKVSEKNKHDVRLMTGIVSLYNTLNYFTDNPYNEAQGAHLFNILDKAEALAPKNLLIYWTRAQVYIWKGDYDMVEDTYRKAIAIEPDVTDSKQLLERFTKALENMRRQ